MSPNLSALLPRDKFDLERAEAVVEAGYPAVEPLLPELIEWIKDANWPVARVLAPFLAGIGSPLRSHVAQVLQATDDTWKYWVIELVVRKSADLRAGLREELERIAFHPGKGEVSEDLPGLAKTLLNGSQDE